MTTTASNPNNPSVPQHPRYDDTQGSVLFELYGEFERFKTLMQGPPGYTIQGDLAHLLLMTIEGAARTGDAEPMTIPSRFMDAWWWAADLDEDAGDTVYQVMQALFAIKNHPARAAFDEILRSSARAVKAAADSRE